MIGNRIKELRKTFSHLSATEFGKKVGKSNGYISELENNIKKPSETLIIAICAVFQVNREWLENGKEPMLMESNTLACTASDICKTACKICDKLPKEEQSMILRMLQGMRPRDGTNDTASSKLLRARKKRQRAGVGD